MKKFLLPFFAFLLVFGMACNETTTEDTTETQAETPSEESTEETASTDDATQADAAANYEITVIDPAPKSPRKAMSGSVAGADITVNYGSPSVKGRVIWGSLEPYDKVWRAGANEATTIETSADLTVEGETLPAGKYSFFLIPTEGGNWTAIFNSVAEQWGAYEYKEDQDVLRVEVSPSFVEENYESLDYMIDGDAVVMRWAKAKVALNMGAAQ